MEINIHSVNGRMDYHREKSLTHLKIMNNARLSKVTLLKPKGYSDVGRTFKKWL
jgi:hypothetical protein